MSIKSRLRKLWIWILQDNQPLASESQYPTLPYRPDKVLKDVKEFEKGLDAVEESLNTMFDDFVGSQSK